MTIEERVDALERGLSVARRRNRYLLVGLVVLAIGWIFTSTTGTVQAQAGDNIIRAEGFELVDAEGNVKADLFADETGPRLELYGENGSVRAGLFSFEEIGAGLYLSDKNGTTRTSLRSYDDSGPWLDLYDENGTNRVELGVSDDGPGLTLKDENGMGRAGMSAPGEFGPRLDLWDENGQERAILLLPA